MRLAWNPEFTRQLQEYDLRYTCVDCAYLCPERQRCAHGWPRADHQHRHLRSATTPDQAGEEVVFCKEFELR